jgi:hypothetical protein
MGFLGSKNTNLLLNPLADLLFSVYSRDVSSVKYNAKRVKQKELGDGQPGKRKSPNSRTAFDGRLPMKIQTRATPKLPGTCK